MAIQARKGSDAVALDLVAGYNALRATVAVAATKFHADVTSSSTLGGFDAHAAAALLVTSASATNTGTGVTLANELKAKLNVHMADAIAHKTADVANGPLTTADASDDATTVTLATAIQTAYNAHVQSTTYHYTADTNTDSTTISSASTARTSLTAIKALYNVHIASAPAGSSLALLSS